MYTVFNVIKLDNSQLSALTFTSVLLSVLVLVLFRGLRCWYHGIVHAEVSFIP